MSNYPRQLREHARRLRDMTCEEGRPRMMIVVAHHLNLCERALRKSYPLIKKLADAGDPLASETLRAIRMAGIISASKYGHHRRKARL